MMLGIAGYCGILVMVLCIAIIAGLLCWFLRSALKQKNQLGMMMGFGCVMVLAIQFLLSLLANIGVSVREPGVCSSDMGEVARWFLRY